MSEWTVESKWTRAEQIAELHARYPYMTATAIAEFLGTTPATVRGIASRHKIALPDNGARRRQIQRTSKKDIPLD